jgi:hypothetical protein
MKRQKRSAKARSAGKPLDPLRFPAGAQTEPTAGRDKVREVAYPMRAPRQSSKA